MINEMTPEASAIPSIPHPPMHLVEQVSFDEYPILMVSFLDKTNKSTDHHFGGRPNRAKLARLTVLPRGGSPRSVQ